MIYLLFGEMGVGKNYVGEKLAKRLGCRFFDGDDAIPEWMRRKVRNFKFLTLGDLDEFVCENLIPAIGFLHAPGEDLVVAQALYKRRHRMGVVTSFRTEVKQIYVAPPSFREHMRRLYGRRRGLRWMLYGLASKPCFQKPRAGEAGRIISGSDVHIDAMLSLFDPCRYEK